jgi:hypothetical protein
MCTCYNLGVGLSDVELGELRRLMGILSGR